MKVWVEKTGETKMVFVNVPTGSNIKVCIDAAQVQYIAGESIFLNGNDVVNGRKVDLNTAVKENDTVQVVPNYSGGREYDVDEIRDLCDKCGLETDIYIGCGSAICCKSLTPSLC